MSRKFGNITEDAEKLSELQEYILKCFRLTGRDTLHGAITWIEFEHVAVRSIRLLYSHKHGMIRVQNKKRDVYEFSLSDLGFARLFIGLEVSKARNTKFEKFMSID